MQQISTTAVTTKTTAVPASASEEARTTTTTKPYCYQQALSLSSSSGSCSGSATLSTAAAVTTATPITGSDLHNNEQEQEEESTTIGRSTSSTTSSITSSGSSSSEHHHEEQLRQQQQEERAAVGAATGTAVGAGASYRVLYDDKDELRYFLNDLRRASLWNQGCNGIPTKNKKHDNALWDIEFCRSVAHRYDKYLDDLAKRKHQREQMIVQREQRERQQQHETVAAAAAEAAAVASNDDDVDVDDDDDDDNVIAKELCRSDIVVLAFKVLIKCRMETADLARKVRHWERCLGKLKLTKMNDRVSMGLITANGKAGNVGRCMSLLELREQRNYPARRGEFWHAVTSLQAAGAKLARHENRGSRNIFLSDQDQIAIDNPTRWLDTILLQMSRRGVPLDAKIANHMLLCYGSTGKTGKAVHHFYRIKRDEVVPTVLEDDGGGTNEDEDYHHREEQPVPPDTSKMPQRFKYNVDQRRYTAQPIKVRMHYHKTPPPFYKVPSQVRGKVMAKSSTSRSWTTAIQAGKQRRQRQLNNGNNNGNDGGEGNDVVFADRLEQEMDEEFSLPLAAAFSFANLLQLGTCGHDPIELNTGCYNALIKACVNRGALNRAMHVLDNAMDPERPETKPTAKSYNLVLQGLARVADVQTSQEYYTKMVNDPSIRPDGYTVCAIADGLLNLGDASSACTVVQDFFNQHMVLPPYTTHVKILEHCLARDMIYEAKRHVYFIQQLWYWEPNEYHRQDERGIELIKKMKRVKNNTQLQKPALQKLFAYFGQTLDDSDFL